MIDDILTSDDLRMNDDVYGYTYTLSNVPVYRDKMSFLVQQSRDASNLAQQKGANQQFNDLDISN